MQCKDAPHRHFNNPVNRFVVFAPFGPGGMRRDFRCSCTLSHVAFGMIGGK